MPDIAKCFTCKISFSPQHTPMRYILLLSQLLRGDRQGSEKLNLLKITWLESARAVIQTINLSDIRAHQCVVGKKIQSGCLPEGPTSLTEFSQQQ